MFNPIIIIEGPAGSGKSTVSKAIVEKTGLKLVSGSLPERTPKPERAPALSWFNDLQKMSNALSSNGSVVDRWGLSQTVYGTLRRADAHNWDLPAAPAVMPNHLVNLDAHIRSLYDDLAWRYTIEGLDRPPTPTVVMIVLLPPVQVISHRRRTAGRDFQWDAGVEHRLYNSIPRRCGRVLHRIVTIYDVEPMDKVMPEVNRLLRECKRG